MAITKPTTVPNSNGGIQSSGNFTMSKHLFGATGAKDAGDKSEWMQINQIGWKSLILRLENQVSGTDVTTGTVRVEFAIALADVDPNTNTKPVLAATLTAGAPSLSLEPPYGYVRVVIQAADPLMMQVDFHGLGV